VTTFRVVEAGDSTLVVEFDERIDPAVNARVVELSERLRAEPVPGVRDVVPAYRSVAVYFDPLRTTYEVLVDRLQREAAVPDLRVRPKPDVVRIPVCYGGEFGPDLASVAKFAGMTESAVVELHTARSYLVFMLGFAPGMAYLGVVDGRIAAPRHEKPRVHVARGSVGIAGEQTGIYPASTPGGWQIIGRTPLKPFDLTRPSPFLMKPGDSVVFFAVDRIEFDRLEQIAQPAVG
jgi:KipI family sensor histidine kinase inhibitor